jgi:hypothetical protein
MCFVSIQEILTAPTKNGMAKEVSSVRLVVLQQRFSSYVPRHMDVSRKVRTFVARN